jgi:hypothetical protein
MLTTGGIIFPKEVMNKMVIDKLSDKAKVALLSRLENCESEVEIRNALAFLADIADQLDHNGLCEAADKIDDLIKKKLKKLDEPGRLMAKQLREKFLKSNE